MNKKPAHYEALGYEPLRMKPAHFASGFFTALDDSVYANELLNKVAVTKSNKGLVGDYSAEQILGRLRDNGLIEESMTQADVELLRILVNGIVNNDSAMYPAFKPYNPKGNDYTFISPRVLTKGSQTDGYAGHFVVSVLVASPEGKAVLDFARMIAKESPSTLERFVNPLLSEESESSGLAEKYDVDYGELAAERIDPITKQMRSQTEALARLCENLADYSHYRRIRYLTLGLLAWLFNYLLRTAAVDEAAPLLLCDFVGEKEGPIRQQSQTCYARLREIVRLAYKNLAEAGRFSEDWVANGLFARRNHNGANDFRFLEEHFGDLALRMGYAQPRASQIPQKHFELQPDTLRTLMLSILHHDAASAITFDELCERLRFTWNIVVGGHAKDYEILRRSYFGFDEADLRRNADAFASRLGSLNLAVEPSDGLVLCSREIGEVL